MLEVITADETLYPGSTGVPLLGPRETPAALQIASQRLAARAFRCTSGKTMNPRTTEITKIAAAAATLRTTQGSLGEKAVLDWVSSCLERRRTPR